MGNDIVVDETIAYHIIRDWLSVYVYAGHPVADLVVDGLATNLVSDLRKGVDPRKTPPSNLYKGDSCG